MAEYNIIETRTIVQERALLVEAEHVDDIWLRDDFTTITTLSDWETISSDEEVTDVRVPL